MACLDLVLALFSKKNSNDQLHVTSGEHPLEPEPTLSIEERARLAVQYDAIMDMFAKRHGISVQQLAEAVHWVHKHRDWVESMKRGGALALIGFLASALLLAIWEGIKQLVRRG